MNSTHNGTSQGSDIHPGQHAGTGPGRHIARFSGKPARGPLPASEMDDHQQLQRPRLFR